MLIDTHCHLCDARFDDDRQDVIERARSSGVGHIIVIADNEASTRDAIELASRHGLSATAGVHPHEASTWTTDTLGVIERALAHPTVVAVGEAGLDYHYEHSPRRVQREVFETQLELAMKHNKPVVVHNRSSDRDMASMLRDTEASVVLHSFSSGPRLLQLGLDRRDYISFSGMVTFKSWKDIEAVRSVPDDRVLVETDSPYLAPVPHRGERNEPALVRNVAERVAELREVTIEQLTSQTTMNAERCFGTRVTQQSAERT